MIRWKDKVTTAREVLATWGYVLHLVPDDEHIPGKSWEGLSENKLANNDPMLRTFSDVAQHGKDIWLSQHWQTWPEALWHEVGHAAVAGRAGHRQMNWQDPARYDVRKSDNNIETAACGWTAAILAVIGAPLDFIAEAMGYVGAEDNLVYKAEGLYGYGERVVGVLPPTQILKAAIAWHMKERTDG